MVSSEPFLYDTTYMPIKQNKATPVNEYGRCCTADEVGDRDKITMRPKKWKSASYPQMKRSVSLLQQRNLKKSMQELRNGLESIDKGCQHGHYTDWCSAAKFASQVDEQEQLHELLEHPFTCAIGMCRSLLRPSVLFPLTIHDCKGS